LDKVAKARTRHAAEEGPIVRKPAAEAYPYIEEASSRRIPFSARWILSSTDLQATADARRRNFMRMAELLHASEELYPLRTTLDADTVPWGFPVILRNRAQRDYLIRRRGVAVFTFGEVLHPLLFEQHAADKAMLETTSFLSNSVLAFAINQDLSVAQVAGFAREINDYVAGL
jgi:hypothetical protein